MGTLKHMPGTYLVQRSARGSQTIPVTFSAFPDGDTHCVIADAHKVRPAPALVVHPLYPAQNEQLIRLLLLIDLLHDLGVTEVSVFCPYVPYSRQDKRHIAGEALAMQTICRMLARAGCTRLYVVDCHFMRGTAEGVYEGLHIINIAVSEMLLDICRTLHLKSAPFHIIGPDKGASLLAPGAPSQHMHKTRGEYAADVMASNPGATQSHRDVVDVAADHLVLVHPTVVVIDDMVSTGTTMLRAVQNLRDQGSRAVYCVCTHGLFVGDSFAQLAQAADGIIVGDTVPHPSGQPIVSKLLQETILPHWVASASAPKVQGSA